jgi:hypothetical protein
MKKGHCLFPLVSSSVGLSYPRGKGLDSGREATGHFISTSLVDMLGILGVKRRDMM